MKVRIGKRERQIERTSTEKAKGGGNRKVEGKDGKERKTDRKDK